jgi:4-amino-4-deoxy-L-arabinose transferase-like glycosyltransferase
VPYPLRRVLPAIALLALAVRVAYILLNRDFVVAGDALSFHLEGGFLAHGEGFRRAFEDVPTAEYPPLHTVMIAGADLLGLSTTQDQKLFFAVIGSITVVLIAVLGARVGGSERVGAIAGALAALYPMLWLPDGALMAESTYGLWLVATLLLALELARRPTVLRAAALGVAGGLAALSRGEGLALLALVALVAAWRAGGGFARRAQLLGVVAAATLVVLAPWTVRNVSVFHRLVPISNNANEIWVGANCPDTYYGSLVGAWKFQCYGRAPAGDETERALAYRRRGVQYMTGHLGRLPVVVAARIGRVLDVYRPWGQGAFLASAEGRHPRAQHLGLIAYWLLVPWAVAGAVLLRRRRRDTELLLLVAPVALVLLVAATTYGSTRFRFAAEPGLVVLGAVTVDAVLGSLLRARRRPASATATSESAGISQSQSMEAWKA